MGKSLFKMRIPRDGVANIKGIVEIPRAEVVEKIDKFAQGQLETVCEELHNLAVSAEYLAFGGWYLKVPVELRSLLAGQPEACGCPLASISDWVDAGKPLDGTNIRNLREGDVFFSRWDSWCGNKAGFTVGAVRVID